MIKKFSYLSKMLLILGLFAFFVSAGWLIGRFLGTIFFPKSNDKTIINNYYHTTENHLHITDKDLKKLS